MEAAWGRARSGTAEKMTRVGSGSVRGLNIKQVREAVGCRAGPDVVCFSGKKKVQVSCKIRKTDYLVNFDIRLPAPTLFFTVYNAN